jgi:hypothetical protein
LHDDDKIQAHKKPTKQEANQKRMKNLKTTKERNSNKNQNKKNQELSELFDVPKKKNAIYGK